MTKHLISFVGRPQLKDGIYQKTDYHFDGDYCVEQAQFFGLALIQWYNHAHPRSPIDSVTFVGTRGSIWQELYRLAFDVDGDDAHGQRYLELAEAAEQHQLTSEHLGMMPEHINGVRASYRLIPPSAFELTDQTSFLAQLGDILADGDVLLMDITHGYRHLPLMAAEAALFVQQVRRIQLGGVFYGQFGQDKSSAVCLDAFGQLTRWVQALTVLQHTGRFGELPELLNEAGQVGLSRALTRMEFAMNTHQFQMANSAHHVIGQELQNVPDDALLQLIWKTLKVSINALFPGTHLARWQLGLAKRALAHHNYVQCATNLYEAQISAAMANEEQRWAFQHRKDVSGLIAGEDSDFRHLSHVRNNLAHGNKPKKAQAEIMRSPDSLHAFLTRQIEQAEKNVEYYIANPKYEASW